MATPAGYSQDNDGWYWKNDGTGPYSISSGGVAALLGTTIVNASLTGFSLGPGGFYYYSDKSGPYIRGSGGIYKFLA